MSMMRIVEPGTMGRGLTPLAPPDAPEPAPQNWLPSVGAYGRIEPGLLMSAFGYDSDVSAAADLLTRPQYKMEPGFSPLPVIKGTKYEEFYLDSFVGAGSEAETRDIMARLDREEVYRQNLAAGGWRGMVASMLAGVVSPTSLVPIGGWLKAGATGTRIAVRSAEGAAVVGATVAGQEAILQAAQESRSATETAFAVAMGVAVGGVLGPFVKSRAELDAITRKMQEYPATAAEEAQAWNRAVSAGAAATDAARGSGELAGAMGAEKAFSFQDPLIRLQTSPFVSARNTVRDLAETPLTLAENADGIATTIGGAIDTRVKMAHAPLSIALSEMDTLYSRYFFGDVRRFAPARGTASVMMGRGGGKLSYSAYKEAVWEALLNGDVHAIPEAAEAARTLRSRVFDPLKDEAIAARLFPEDIKPLDDVGYVPRLYDTNVIRARRTDFTSILAKHFEARQADILEEIAELERRTGAENVDPKAIKPKMEELTPNEIKALAEEITDTILGNSPARVLTPADLTQGPRGPLKERVLRIPTSLIRDFVEKDPEVLARRYTQTMAADIGLVKRFGSTDMADQIAKINDEANAQIAAMTGEKAKAKIDAQRRAAIRDLAAIRDRIRGNYALPDNPDGLLVRSGRVARNLNYLRLLGGMTLSAIPDMAKPVMVYGLTRTMRTAFTPMVRGLKTVKLAAKEVKLAGTALDMVLDSRVMAIADIMDDYGRGSKFERALQTGTQKFGLVSAMAPWNAAIKQFVGIIGQTKILQSVERVVAGKATRKEVEYLASNGIDANMADRIWKQFDGTGVRDGDVWWANTESWTDRQAVESIRAALVRDVDRVIVTPGQDKPLWMSTEMGKLIGQFRSFNIASTQRTLIAGLQQRDRAAFEGMVMMLGLGALSYYLKMEIGGYDVSSDPAKWATEAFDRSGLAGWIGDANNMVEKLTRGHIGLSAFTGEQATRYASRNALGALLGPTFDQVGDAIQITGSAFAGDWTAADSRAFRKLVPLQNLFYIRSLFDKVEAGANQALGIPQRAGGSAPARSMIR